MSEGWTPVAHRPDHVPESAVYDFDIFLDEGMLKDPDERLRGLVSEAPSLFWSPRNGGHWMALSYEAALEVARDWERFSNQFIQDAEMDGLKAALPADYPHIPHLLPLTVDPPDHVKYRAPLASAFGPKAIKARTEEIRSLASSLVADAADRGSCDFIATVSEPLPVLVFLRMMGLPLERCVEFRALVHKVLGPGVLDLMENATRFRSVADAIGDVIRARRDEPKDDLISHLWGAEIDGEAMTMETMEDFCVMLFMAGLDTVINAGGFAVRHMAVHPELQDQLRADPSLIPEAVEEMLRRYSFVTPVRRAKRDMEFFGRTLKQGDRIMYSTPASGLDPAHWGVPEAFDIARENKAHIAFGAGPHRCVGSHLARLELQILYAEVLKGLPTFRLDARDPVRYRPGSTMAVVALPIRWD